MIDEHIAGSLYWSRWNRIKHSKLLIKDVKKQGQKQSKEDGEKKIRKQGQREKSRTRLQEKPNVNQKISKASLMARRSSLQVQEFKEPGN